MIIDYIDQQEVKVVNAVTPYQDDNIYWAFVDHNNQLLNLFGFQYNIEVEPCELGRPIKLGHINEDAFIIIKKSLLTSSVLCYIDEDQQELIYFRFVIKIDKKSETSIHVTVNFQDEHDQSEPIDDIKIKSSRLPTKKGAARKCKIDNIEDNMFNIEFLDPGDYNIKVSGHHKGTKVKAYIPWSI